MRGRKPLPERERIYAKVDMSSADGCWRWTAATNGCGYGVLSFRGKSTLAHRAVYILERGSIPHGTELDHTCRNRACCNPAHLEPVSHHENMRRSPFTIQDGKCRKCGGELSPVSDGPKSKCHGKQRMKCRPCNIAYLRARRLAAAFSRHDSQAGLTK